MHKKVIRVLTIDDDFEDVDILRNMLNGVEDTTYEVDWAKDGPSGLDILVQDKHDICFVDYRLVDHSGLDVIRDAEHLDVKVPMILLTGAGGLAVDLEAGVSGAADYLIKGELNSILLERTIRYTLIHHRDKEMLRHSYAELKRTQAQLLQSDKLASIGILAAGLVHEINTPTACVIGSVEMLSVYVEHVTEALNRLKKLADSHSDRNTADFKKELNDILGDDRILGFSHNAKELITDAMSGIQRVRRTASSLKGFAQKDRGEFQMVDLNELINHAIELLRLETKHKCDVTTEFTNVPLVLGNANQLEQVFVNLLLNAVQAISRDDGQIRIRTYREDYMVCVSITDNGSGIPSECIPHIYDPFFTTKAANTGTGLGLSITYGIIQGHRGKIDVSSQVGEGTTFSVRFPV